MPPTRPSSPFPELSDLGGAHVLICGSGDAATRAAAQLRDAGATSALAPDPYVLVRQLSAGEVEASHVMLLLGCLFPEELAVIDTLRAIVPHARLLVAGGEGSPGLFAASIRAGVDGIWVGRSVEWLGDPLPPASAPPHEPGPSGLREALPRPARAARDDEPGTPLLSTEELRALLGEEPAA